MVVLSWIMDHGRTLGMALPLVNAAALTFFAVITASPLLLYPLAFFRGYGAWERILASLIPLSWWWITEVALRMELHSLPESVFLTLSVVNYVHYQLLALEIVIAEIGCRWIASRYAGRQIKVFSRPVTWSTAAILVLVLSDPWLLERYYFGFQETYQSLFLQGKLPTPKRFLGALPEGALARAHEPTDLPNIVVILSDDHRWDYMGNAGHPFVETPNLDRIAAEGVRFNNAFVTSSLCSPSRASFLTGLYPHRHGVFNNFTPWNNQNRTFFEYLKRAGYRTAFIGKWHMPGELPELRGVDEFVTFTVSGGQGWYHDCPLVVNGREEPSRKRYIAEELTDRALAFMEDSREEPFLLFLSHKSVHAPFTPDPRERGRYRAQPIDLPDGSHSWVNMTHGNYAHLMLSPLESVVRRYGEAVSSLDREIGRVLDGLVALGLAENTLLIYTSDNGQFWGEHQLIDKRWAYEDSIRIPLLVRYPRMLSDVPVEIDRMILNIDLAPTLLDVAGVNIPDAMQGRSILALLRDHDAPWRDAFYYHYAFEPPFPVPTIHAVRTDRHKYIEYEGRDPELFDLDRDPREQRNLVETAAGRKLQGQLKDRRDALKASAENP
jgi:N-acetylglucosamine-6-sulfatase